MSLKTTWNSLDNETKVGKEDYNIIRTPRIKSAKKGFTCNSIRIYNSMLTLVCYKSILTQTRQNLGHILIKLNANGINVTFQAMT